MTKSPAELLAAKKPPRRERKAGKGIHRPVWTCKIREARNALGLSLDDVAEAIKLSKTALWQIEHGGDPMLTTARRLATFFGKSVEELWPSPAPPQEEQRP